MESGSERTSECPLPNLRLDMLHAFVVLCEELHFGRAASRLFLSPSGLSRRIRQVEAEVNTTLFSRNSRQVTVTAAGLTLLPVAEALLGRARELERLIQAMSTA
jgi:DNA-binding transcriptional LysR family regulator